MTQDKTASADFKMEYVQPPEGLFVTYANNFSIGQTVFDLRVLFGELMEVVNKTIKVRQTVQVTMSWLEAKALAEALAAYIYNYEQSYGPIKTEFAPIKNPPMPKIPLITSKPSTE